MCLLVESEERNFYPVLAPDAAVLLSVRNAFLMFGYKTMTVDTTETVARNVGPYRHDKCTLCLTINLLYSQYWAVVNGVDLPV